MTTARAWPEELISGEHPSRGQDAVVEHARVQRLLEQGWEPFAVIPDGEATQVWFKRQTKGEEQ